MTKIYTAIGLMSGTSCDGIDASIIQSDGEERLKILFNDYIAFDIDTIENIKKIREKINKSKDLKLNIGQINKLEEDITFLHAKSVKQIMEKAKIKHSEIDVIGFHGQTIFHSAADKISKQIGSGELLNKLTGLNVVYNFRENDIKNGGQGAPLTPIYHELIQRKLKTNLPVVFLNIGGIANITYINKKKKIYGYDSGPGNCLMDQFLQIKTDYKIKFDKNGEIAKKGNCNEIILENYLNDSYYNLQPPKTLDIKDFSLSIIRGLSIEDSIATLAELTVRTIVDSLNFFKDKPELIILMGGGRKNNYFLEKIQILSKIKTINIDSLNFDGDFIESQTFAYLAIRSKLKKIITYPETTGVTKASTGGDLIEVK